MRPFEVGDKVTFEISLQGHYPRWIRDRDTGGCGVFEEGTVINVFPAWFLVAHEKQSKTPLWTWPQFNSAKWPKGPAKGYVRLAKNPPKGVSPPAPHLCHCELKLLFAQGCQCGGK